MTVKQPEKRVNKIPLFLSPVAAGFPSAADDYLEKKLDLNEFLVKHPAATFFVKVKGESMTGAGICSEDILIVDRSLEPKDKRVAVVVLDGEFTVKRIRKKDGKLFLVPENKEFKPVEITPSMDFEVWGVVTHVIHSL